MAAGFVVGLGVPAWAAVPTITGFSPTGGPVGTSVTVSGTGFTGATSVAFGRKAAIFSVGSDTTITTTVPSGAITNGIVVTTPSGTVTSKKRFKVTPQISDFTPKFGPAGTPVTISGSAFTKATGVTFNGVAATFTVNSYSQISATVPAGATSGPLAVTTKADKGTSSATFTVGQIFDVTAYGAHGDGTGDNSAAFAAAIAAQTAGGGIVSVPSGTYDFLGGTPASILIHGTVPITLASAGRDTTKLVKTTAGRKDLLSIRCDGTVVQDITLDTQTFLAGHGLGDGSNNTTAQRIRVFSAPRPSVSITPVRRAPIPGMETTTSTTLSMM